ncbi:unnamed protein product [Fraxinus pennsylvanica]|uniref:FLZ-type domain-containing protein n=1 Tax=Fraxinus pennsylvanica TaxID=56036 RepID=A0AAD1ZQ96_9LAMI|nr:unnamed protein product [Fraxinus pennsylvanica]
MLDSEGNNNRKIKSDEVGLAIVSSLVDGTEINSDHQLITRNLPDSSTYFVHKTLNPLVTNPNPFYKNFGVIPNPVTTLTRIGPCLLTSNGPVSVFSSKQSQISSNVGVGLKNDNQDAKLIVCSVHGNSRFLRLEDTQKPDEYSCATRNGLVFEVVNMFINDCILELPPSSQLENFSLNGVLASLPGSSSSSTQYLESDEFLKYCYDCNKALDGNDIYMYSDKPFCSNECREKDYMKDSNLKKAAKSV